jgi:hypothetical protein
MTQWDTIPNEVLIEIVSYLEHNFNQESWIFVNRHWHLLYDSIAYKEIYVGLTTSDKIYDMIVNSLFHPGQ